MTAYREVTSPPLPTPEIFLPIVVADVNDDGFADVLAGCGPDLSMSFLHERLTAFDRNGEMLPGYPLGMPNDCGMTWGRVPVVGDITGDGNLDILYASGCSSVCFASFPQYRYSQDLAFCPMWRCNRRLNAEVAPRTAWTCVGRTGNVNCDPEDVVDVTDIQVLIDNQFLTFKPLCCFEEADMDLSGSVDITDLALLIDNQFLTLTPLPYCP